LLEKAKNGHYFDYFLALTPFAWIVMSSKNNFFLSSQGNREQIWPQLRKEAMTVQIHEPLLADLVHQLVVDRANFSDALAYLLAEELVGEKKEIRPLRETIIEAYKVNPNLITAAQNDLMAILERDPAATSWLMPFLFFKGFHALQSYRIAHWLWIADRHEFACYIQNLIAKRLSVDIHPAARIGQGVMMDHANGIVIGETSVVEDNVSFLHSVTLGGTGKECGDRHPKIRSGVMIGAGAKILGNIEIGTGARVAAGSVVLENVPPHVTVAGVPARVIGQAGCDNPANVMNQMLVGEDT
jgi:serine O-acetyltransferase